MKRLSLIVLVLSFTFAAPVTAYTVKGEYKAVGTITCGLWFKYRAQGGWMENAVIGYISGYITAYNFKTPDVHNIMGSTDIESVYLWMDKYCQENPLSMLSDGMEELTYELWPNRERTAGD